MAFDIPKNFLNKLFSLTGDGKKNQGFMLFYLDEKGYPCHRTITDSIATTFTLRKMAENELNALNKLDEGGRIAELMQQDNE